MVVKYRKLRDYQMGALLWSDNVTHPGFFVDLRMGKCLISIRRLKRWGITGPVLIICPNSAIQSWCDDLVADGFETPIELTGTKENRRTKLNDGMTKTSTFFIINKEGYQALPEIAKFKWFSVILDESRFIANPRSKVSKFFHSNFRDVEHRIILTGTPDFKDKLDYFQQLTFLDPKNLPYKNYWEFKNTAFHMVGMYDLIMKKKHGDILKKSIAKNCYVLRRKDFDLGRTKTYMRRYVEMPPAVKKMYATMEQEFILEYKGEVKMSTIYATTAHISLMRLCGGVYDNETLHETKVKELKSLLENEFYNEKVIICCRFIDEINMLKATLEKKYKIGAVHGDVKTDRRRELIRYFNAGNIDLIIAQPSTISHGVDLSGGETIIYYSQPNGDEIRQQSEDRIITMADEKAVLIVDILVKDTVDHDARQSCILGESQRQMFNRAVKRYA